ncbi:hypothetical protein [Microbacterium sp. NPDC056569]|uniref:hypothetical protein n=1 Tax=Microbacterium sp. NPDC056569 TaxID=3345867 RepID=UPI00366C91E4
MKNPMKKAAATAALVLCATFGGAAAAQADSAPYSIPATSEGNHEATWGDNCEKIEFAYDGVTSYFLPDTYTVVVVKAGRTNTVYEFFGGGYVSSLSGKDISHIIYCPGDPSGT